MEEAPGDRILLRPAPVEGGGSVPALAKMREVGDVALPAAGVLERVVEATSPINRATYVSAGLSQRQR